MDLSVVIVYYKARERIIRCLEALASFTDQHFSMEVIVVNNNPGDEYFSVIEDRFKRFTFITNQVNGGYSNGCNKGAEKAAGDYLLFLNPDTVVTEEAVNKLLIAAKHDPSFYIVSCRQVRENGKESKAYGYFPWRRKEYQPVKEVISPQGYEEHWDIVFPDWVSGSLMMIRKKIFEKLEGFDEDFWMYYEDVDLCRRAKEAGGRTAFCPDITIEHHHGGSTRENLKITSIAKSEVQISRHLYFHKHESGKRRILIQIITVADNLITGLISSVTGLLLFFIPELFVRFLVFIKVIGYYKKVLLRLSWISPRSVNFRN